MRYLKPPLNFRDQAKRVISRGLIANLDELESFLSKVNYYRFTGYLYPFRDGGERFFPRTTFNQIRSIYNFDTELRWLTFSAIETIDISILRTMLVEKFTLVDGAFCYLEFGNFEKMSHSQYGSIIREIETNTSRSKEEFVAKYHDKYDEEHYLPFWMVAELSSFGMMSRIFQHSDHNVKVPISKRFNLHSSILSSWLHSLTNVRNICAHHARLWNRVLPVKPKMPPKKYLPEFFEPLRINNERYFVILTVIKYLLDYIEPDNTFIEQFQTLLSEHPEVPIEKMGIPENWEEYPIFGL